MKRWVLTATIDPAKLKGVVSAKMEGDEELSGSVMFVWYSKTFRRWEWVLGGGRIELIEEPTEIFVDEGWVRENVDPNYQPKIFQKSDHLSESLLDI